MVEQKPLIFVTYLIILLQSKIDQATKKLTTATSSVLFSAAVVPLRLIFSTQ